MAKQTDIRLRGDVIYSIYVRNHTPEGTFNAVLPDLDRIKALGTDIIWFMPIHPIGVKGKKGSLGCPYANRDYRTVNPEYGTMEDFRTLVDEIHKRDMKCIIDVVYNHTSPDSTLTTEHPEFFYRKSDGSMGNRVGDWTDVVDLDYGCKALWDYQIESLVMWAGIVDGFRCDVASLVPVDFWCAARKAVERVHPGCIWLAETVHSGFSQMNRKLGMYSANDYEMFSAFDMEYEYDIREVFDRYLNGECTLSNYIDMLNFQECAYPENYIKMRCLENHDQPRICSFVKDEKALENFTAFLYFLKGSTLIYAGQEYRNDHVPSLFEKDIILRTAEKDISPLLRKLYDVKKSVLSVEDYFKGTADDIHDIAILERDDNHTVKVGVFSLKGKAADVKVQLPDGTYTNHLNGEPVAVTGGMLRCDGDPILLTIPAEQR
jgi:glycosidase